MIKYILLFIPGVFVTLCASGQVNTANDTIPVRRINLNEIVFSANKTGETKRTVAQQVQILSSTDIPNSQAQSTADLIANSGNVFVQKSQLGGGDIDIRGFSANQNVLVIDGVRMNTLIFRAGHLQDIIKTDNNILDRVEILFGPSSTIYGSDALGGVIHLYTKNPPFSDHGSKVKVNVLSRLGSADHEMTEHIDLSYGTLKFGSLSSFTNSKFGDLMGGKNRNPFYGDSYGERPYYAKRIGNKDSLFQNPNRFLQVASGYSQSDFLQKFQFRQNDKITHCINIQYSTSGNVPRYDRLTDPVGSGLKSAEWYYGPQNRLLTAYDLNIKNIGNKFQNIHFGLNYQGVEESRHNRNFGSDILKNRIEKVGVLGANLDFQKIIGTHNLRFGADMQLNNLKSTAHTSDIVTGSVGKLDTRFPDGVNRMTNLAAYFSHTWKITNELTLNDGVRAGYSAIHSTLVDLETQFNLPYTSINQNSPVYSGNIALIRSPSDNLKYSVSVSTGYRVPNVDDMSKIFAPASGTVVVPNINLKPERTINYELGLTKIFNSKTKWESFVYYTQFVNAVETANTQFNGMDSIMYDGFRCKAVSNQNKGRAYIYGFSSDLNSLLTDKFTLSIMVNYTYGRLKTDSSDTPLNHIAPFLAHLQLGYINKKFSSDFFINYNGWKRMSDYCVDPGGEDNEAYATPKGMPAWFTLNLRASYRMNRYLTLQGGIDNILDTQYRTFASGINGSGRNLFFAVRGNF